MNAKIIAVIAVTAVLIGLVFALPVKPGDVTPSIMDEAQIKDNAKFETDMGVEDLPAVEDSSTTNTELEVEYSVGDNGTKHYSIEAKDSPSIRQP